jgi:hypothetical protein
MRHIPQPDTLWDMGGVLSVDEDGGGVFDSLFQGLDHGCGVEAVYEAVIEG